MDIYAGDIPALTQYNALVQQMDAGKNDAAAEATSDLRKDIQRFREKNPQRRIKPVNVVSSVRAARRCITPAKDGVYLTRSHEGAREAGAFASE